MSDENQTQTANENPNQNAQQALDDLTVLSDVGTQDMGQARLNNVRAVDVSEGALGTLATIHQGSGTGVATQQGLAVQMGDIATEQVVVETADVTVAPVEGGSAPAALLDTAFEATPAPAPQLAGQSDLYGGNIIFGSGMDVAPTEAAAAASAPAAAEAPEVVEATVPAAPEAPLHIDQLPVFDGVARIIVDGQNPNAGGPYDMAANEGEDLRFRVNAFDPDGGTVTIDFSAGDHGVVSYDTATGQYVYHPTDENWWGTDHVTVYVRDDEGNVVQQEITINYSNVDDEAVANVTGGTGDESATGDATVVTGSISATDIDGAVVGYEVVGGGSHNGTLTIDEHGNFTFTAKDANWNGTDTFTVRLTDALGGTTEVQVPITVNATDEQISTGGIVVDGSTGSTDSVGVTEDTSLKFSVDVSNPYGGQSSVSFADPAHGSISVNPDGSYSYTPAPDYFGSDTITYTVTDSEGGSVTKTITVNVENVDDQAVVSVSGGTGAESTTSEATKVTGTISATDADGAIVGYEVVDDGKAHHGTLSVDANGNFTFTAENGNWNGSDSFTVKVTDSQGGVTEVTVPVTVAATEDEATATITGGTGAESTTGEATVVTGTISASDVDNLKGEAVSYEVVGGGDHHGTLTVDANGNFTFTADDANWNGSDSFTIRVTDSQGGTTDFTIPITVAATEDEATATITGGTGAESTTGEATVVTGTISASDVDNLKGEAVSYEVVGGGDHHGTLTVDANGNFTFTADDANWNGSDSFTIRVTDSQGGTTDFTIPITVTATDEQISTGGIVVDGGTGSTDSVGLDEDTSIKFSVDVSNPYGGQSSVSFADPTHGTIVVNDDGSYSYKPDADYFGSDTITYTVTDSEGGSVTKTITVNVENVDDQAVVSVSGGTGAESTTSEATKVTGTISATDADGAIVGYEVVDDGKAHHGTLSVDANGNFTFTAENGNWNGSDSFTVKVTDSQGGVTEVTVPVTVTATDEQISTGGIVVDGGTGSTDSVGLDEDTSIKFSVDVSNPYGGQSSVSFADPGHGTIVVNDDGSYSYKPDADYFGSDTITYTVTDSEGGSVTKTITVNVENVDDQAVVSVSGGTGAESTTSEATKVTGTISATDADGAIVGYEVVDDGKAHHGTLSVDANGNFTFTAENGNWNGSDSFTVKVIDSQGGVTEVTVPITVNATDEQISTGGIVVDGSTGSTDSVGVTEDTSLKFSVDVSNPYGGQSSVSFADPAHGSISVNPDGSYSYTPAPDYFGSDTITYTVTDSEGGSVTKTITVNVENVDDQAVVSVSGGTGAESTTSEATKVTGTISATDADGAIVGYEVVDDGKAHHGTLSVDANGNFTFTAENGNWNGSDSFTVKVTDSQGGVTEVTVPVTVAATEDEATATITGGTGAESTTGEATVVTGTISASDVDNLKGEAVSYEVVGGGDHHGTLTVDANGNFTFTAENGNWNGSDSFTIRVTDSQGGTTDFTIPITVTATDEQISTGGIVVDGGTGSTDSVGLDEDTSIKFSVDVSNPYGGQSSVSFADPAHGSISVNPDGSYSYKPDADYFGSDTITYTVTDSEGGSVTKTITVNVENVDDQAVVSVSGGTGAESTTDQATTVTGTISATDADGAIVGYEVVDDGKAHHGTLSVDANGNFTFTAENGNWNGSDSFTVKVIDSQGGVTEVTVPVTVTATNDGPVVAQVTGGTGAESTTSAATQVTGKISASDVDGDTLSYTVLDNGAAGHNGTLSVDVDGNFTFTAKDSNWNGTDSFTVQVSDGKGGVTTQTVNVNVTATNDAPVVSVVTGGTGAESTTSAATQVTGKISASDVDGDTLSYTVLDNGAAGHNGTLSVDADGNFTFTAKDSNWNGTDSFTVQISDGKGGVTTQTVNVNVTATNDAPVVSVVTGGTGTESTTSTATQVRGTITATDVDGDSLSYSVLDNGAAGHNGTLSVDANGNFVFTAKDSNWNGTDSFTVQISDGKGGVTTQTVNINVTPTNDGPVAGDDTINVGGRVDQSAQAPSLSVDISDAVVTGADGSTGTAPSSSSDWNGLGSLGTLGGTDIGYNAIPSTGGNDAYIAHGWRDGTIAMGAGNDQLTMTEGMNSGTIDMGSGDDKVKLSSNVKNVVLGEGNDQIETGSNAEIQVSLDTGSGDDIVKLGANVKAVNLGEGNDQLDAAAEIQGTLNAGSGDDKIHIHGNANYAIDLGEGADFIKLDQEMNSSLNAGSGDDVVRIGGNINGKIDLGEGSDYLSATGYLNGSTISAGSGNDVIDYGKSGQWSAGGTIDMGSGNDTLNFKGHVQSTLMGGAGKDTLVLSDYTAAQWANNTDNVRNYISGFEKVVLGDGSVVNIDTGEINTSTYTYTVKVDAGLNDTDGSESLSSATISNIPADAKVMLGDQELTRNANGTYTVPLNSAGDATLKVVSSHSLDLSGVKTSVTATETNGGATATTTVTGEGAVAGDTSGASTVEDHAVTIKASTLLANDTDVDGDSLTITGVGNASHGTVSLDASGNVVFTPDANYSGPATFEYTVSDGHGGTDTATVTVNVTATNDAPVVSLVTGGTGTESTTSAATQVTGKITASDADGDTLTYSVVNDGSTHNGTLSVDANGNFTFTAKDASWDGTDSFTVRVSDGHGGTVDVPVSITVTPMADTPVVSVTAGALQQTTISVTDLGGTAGYHNTYGYYVMDDQGNPTTGKILFADTQDSVNQTATIEGVDPSRIGYFVIPNGDGKNCGLDDGESVSFTKDAYGKWQVVDADNHVLSGEGMKVMFSNSALNSDGLAHVVDNANGGNQNWEDQAGGGDKDFDDVNIRTTETSVTAAGSSFDYDASGSSSSSTVTAGSFGGRTYGGAGNDTVNGGWGDDTLYGGSGNDTIRAGSGDTAFGGSGNDTITADQGGCGGVTLVGNSGNDVITGTSSSDVIYGDDAGADANGHSGGYAFAALNITGGTSDSAETLTYVIGDLPDGVTLVNAAGVALPVNADGTYTLTQSQLAGLELKVPTDGSVASLDLTVTAISREGTTTASASTSTHLDFSALLSDGADTLSGGAGADSLYGGGGNDTFIYSADDVSGWLDADYQDQGGVAKDGTDLTVDATGYNHTDDTYFGGSGHDTLVMGSGNDAIHISEVRDVEVFLAGDGNDVVDLNYSDGSTYGAVTVDGGAGDDYIFANDGNDTLLGGSGNDFLSGNAGNDKLYGGAGTDTLNGGAGDDVLNGGAGADKLVGGAGSDTVDYSDSASGVNVYLGAGDGNAYSGAGGYGTGGDAQGDTYSGIENVVGSSHDDYVYGAASGSVVDLGAGNDTFDNSEVSTAQGKDTVDGGAGDDTIWTGNGDDVLKGGSGNDVMYGEAGNDTLIGGTGNDTLVGGDGSDTFLFDFGDGHDTVTGGTGNWTDTLDLTNLGAGVTFTVTMDNGSTWTATTDNTDHVTNLSNDASGKVVINHADGTSDQVDFHSLEQIKW